MKWISYFFVGVISCFSILSAHSNIDIEDVFNHDIKKVICDSVGIQRYHVISIGFERDTYYDYPALKAKEITEFMQEKPYAALLFSYNNEYYCISAKNKGLDKIHINSNFIGDSVEIVVQSFRLSEKLDNEIFNVIIDAHPIGK